MSSFIGGPAAGVSLTLGRSPYFIRAVKDAQGKWDALDQLDDKPSPREEIHVYRIEGEPITAHVDGRDPVTGKRFGKWMSIATYTYYPAQPPDKTARNQEAWQRWCAEQYRKDQQ